MVSRFLSLSEDLLLEICRYVSPADLLSLKQTCRVLYGFSCTDYIWHQIHSDVALNAPSYVKTSDLSAAEIQRLVTRAYRLDHNWRLQWPETKRMTQIDHGNLLGHMQLLDCSRWLYTLARRGASQSIISLWSLHDMNSVHKVLHFDMVSVWRTWAAIQPNGSTMYFATIVRTVDGGEAIHVYSLILPDVTDLKTLLKPTLLHEIPKAPEQGVFSGLHMHRHFVAVTSFNMPHTSVLLFNVHTGTRVHVRLSGLLKNITIKLFDDRIAVAGVKADMALVVNSYTLPDAITSEVVNTSEAWTTLPNLGPPKLSFDPMPVLAQAEYYAASELSRSGDWTLLCIDSKVDVLRHAGEFVARCPPHPPSSLSSPSSHHLISLPVQKYTFNTPPHTLPEHLCIGTSGVRAVWLQRSWDTDVYQVIKLDFPLSDSETRKPVTVGPLFHPQQALPFRLEACHSITFDDAAGRLCFGQPSGEIYVLDFV